jgi:hypothetical protein
LVSFLNQKATTIYVLRSIFCNQRKCTIGHLQVQKVVPMASTRLELSSIADSVDMGRLAKGKREPRVRKAFENNMVNGWDEQSILVCEMLIRYFDSKRCEQVNVTSDE